jgi:hypothetical protein
MTGRPGTFPCAAWPPECSRRHRSLPENPFFGAVSIKFYTVDIDIVMHSVQKTDASVAQPVERVLGKDEVASSNLA